MVATEQKQCGSNSGRTWSRQEQAYVMMDLEGHLIVVGLASPSEAFGCGLRIHGSVIDELGAESGGQPSKIPISTHSISEKVLAFRNFSIHE